MFENNRDILRLCYDSLIEIRDGLYCVSLNGIQKIINENNKVLLDNIKGHVIAGFKNHFYIDNPDNVRSNIYNIDTAVKVSESDFYNFRQIADDAWIVSNYMHGGIGLINSDEKLLLPCEYRYIKLNKATSTKNYLYVRPISEDFLDQQEKLGYKYSYIIADKHYEDIDCHAAIESGIDGTEICIHNLGDLHNRRYQLRTNGKLVGKEYDGIIPRMSLGSHRLLQTHTKTTRFAFQYTTGLVFNDGIELVPSKYDYVEYIGNGLALIKDKDGYGTYSSNHEVIETGIIKDYEIATNIPIVMCSITENGYKDLMIGNDGKLYKSVEMAFPTYRSKINQSIYLLCIYGIWVYTDINLKPINNKLISKELKDRTQWIKL